MIHEIVDYSVGTSDGNIVLCIHGEISSSTLSMSEPAVIKLIRLLAASLDDYRVDIYTKGERE